MNKLEKVLNAATIFLTILIIVLIIIFILIFKEMLNDYRCSQLPLNEFFKDKQCERYWKYRGEENE